jgi:hypothetical protein
MDRRNYDKLVREMKHLTAAMEAGDVPLSLASVKRVRRISTLLVKDIANTRDTLYASEGDKP